MVLPLDQCAKEVDDMAVFWVEENRREAGEFLVNVENVG